MPAQRRMRICFVCLGNICRSPTAHGVMARLVADAGLGAAIAIDSAGTGAYHIGELPDERSRAAARRRGVELSHRARQFERADLERFDLVIAMDRHNLRHLQRLLGGRATPALALLRSFDPTAAPGAEVPDPWAGGEDGFEEVLDQCERACAGLLAHVREQRGW
jgi:protein-tyrosine phosphatase